jgi:glycosyltransferase involved in cell wall biosynthesis
MTDVYKSIRGLVAVPVYNEAPNLPAVIERLKGLVPPSNLLFVDDGSSDGSHQILERAGMRYLRHPINLGYEEAVRTGMREVLLSDYAYVVFFDADGQHQIADLEKIIRVHEAEGFDLVQGSRYLDQGARGPGMRGIGTWFFSRLTTLFAGIKITDATCGMKLISRRFIPVALKLPTEDMHAELIVGLARCGARIREVKITVAPREAGTSMYHFYKALFYPPKTMICLIGELLFCRQLRKTLDPSMRESARRPDATAAKEAP